jgi:hypothetical protein
MPYTIWVQTDKSGAYVMVRDDEGRRFQHYYTFKHTSDANRLARRVNLAAKALRLNPFSRFWREIEPVYGSPAYYRYGYAWDPNDPSGD